MKVVREKILIDAGGVRGTQAYSKIHQQILDAISEIVWPQGSSEFTIYPEKNANGMVPIMSAFVEHLIDLGWHRKRKSPTESPVGPSFRLRFYSVCRKLPTQWVAGPNPASRSGLVLACVPRPS